MKLPIYLQQLNPEAHYIPLKHGRASAYSFGKGPMVLCLHGFPDNCLTYRYQVKPLIQAGYQVVLPVMRGYELGSVQPDKRYYMCDLAEDAVRWVDYFEQEQVHLVGHDWGGVNAWAAVGLAPERIKSVTSIAIPHLKHAAKAIKSYPQQLLYSWYMNFFQLRGLSEWGVSAANWWFIKFLWRQWSPDYAAPDEVFQSVLETLAQPGVKKATLSYYRCMYDAFSSAGRRSQALLRQSVPMPAMLITGENDGCMHAKLFEQSIRQHDFPKGVTVNCVRQAGHFVQLEKPEEVTNLLLNHFNHADG